MFASGDQHCFVPSSCFCLTPSSDPVVSAFLQHLAARTGLGMRAQSEAPPDLGGTEGLHGRRPLACSREVQHHAVESARVLVRARQNDTQVLLRPRAPSGETGRRRREKKHGIPDQVALAGHRGTGSGRNRDRAFAQPRSSCLGSVCCCQYPAAGSEMGLGGVAILSGTRSAVLRNDVRRFH